MSKATKATFVMLVTLCVHLPVSGHGSAAQGKGLSCGASLNWFPQTPPPTNARPNADSDCDFYRWAWQTFLFVVQSNGGQSGPPRFLEFTTPFELFEFGANRNLRSIPKAHIPHDLSAVVQPGSQGVLVDQGGRAVYYATHLNSVFVKFIRENGYTDPDRLRGAPATQPFPKGSLEIKSSWKVVAPGEDTTRFFTVKTALPLLAFKNGQLVAEPSEAREATVALLGLHVVGVVEGHPEFIWATFEHNDNAPDLPPDFVPDARVPIDTQRSWTLYPKGAKAEDCNKRPGQSPIPPLNFTNEEKQIFEPKVCVFREFPFGGDDEPEIIRGLNASVHQRLPPSSAVWKNYGLVGAIWLNTPDRDFKENTDFTAADAGDPGKKVLGGDKKLSNTTMETFGQSTQNCFSCHNTMMQHMGAEAILPPKRLNVSHILTKVYTHVAQSGKRGTQGCSLVTRKEGGSP